MKHIHIVITDDSTDGHCDENESEPEYKVTMRVAPTAHENSMERRISTIFLSLGVPANVKGYVYLREAVKLVVSSPERMSSVTKKLYPAIAEAFGSKPGNVERSIRHAIDVCWQRGHVETLNEICGFHAVSQAEKPSNSELIALIADHFLCSEEDAESR